MGGGDRMITTYHHPLLEPILQRKKTVPLKRRFNRLRLENSLQIVTPERPLGDVELPRWVSWRLAKNGVGPLMFQAVCMIDVKSKFHYMLSIYIYIYIHLIWFVYIYKVHVFVSCMIVWFCVSTLCVHWCCDRCMDQPELCDATMRDHRWKSWTLSCIGSFPPSSSFIGVKDFQTISCLCSFELPTTKMTAVLIIRKGGYAMVPYHVSHGHKIR